MSDRNDHQRRKNEPTAIETPTELHDKALPLTEPAVPRESDVGAFAGTAGVIRDDTARFAWHAHAYVRDFIRLADRKAGFIFAIGIALLSYLHTLSPISGSMRDPRTWAFADGWSVVASVCISVSVLLSLWVVVPRQQGSKRGALFFDAVSEYGSAAEYSDHVVGLAEAELVGETLRHAHELAGVCQRKYAALRKSLWAGFVGIVALVIYYALSSPAAT